MHNKTINKVIKLFDILGLISSTRTYTRYYRQKEEKVYNLHVGLFETLKVKI